MRLPAAILLALALAACRAESVPPTPPPPPPAATATLPSTYLQQPSGLPTAEVLRIIDGDTIDIAGPEGTAQRIRLIGIDAPELSDPRRPGPQCFAFAAAATTEAHLRGKTIALESDPSQGERDLYARFLRYVWLPDGRMLNLELIAAGYAKEFTFERAYRYQAAFKGAQRTALDANLGLWSPATCNGNFDSTLAIATATPPEARTPSPTAAAPPTAAVPPTAAPPPAVAPPTAATPPAAPPTASQPTPVPGRAAPLPDGSCPPSHPIKGNANSGIYHVPGQQFYIRTVAEDCFATEQDAVRAGYRKSRV
jgi:micrococcal nuclease